MAKKIILGSLIIIAVLILFRSAFSVYFVGDDFFHFKISGNLFGFHPISSAGYAFYRPIFRELTYNLSYKFWGLNEIPLRILSFTLHFINIGLVYLLIKKLFKSKRIAFLSSFLFGISAANSGVLYYLAGGLQTQGAALFVLLTLILFPKHKVLAFSVFLLSLMSHELAVVAPFLIAGVMILNKEFKFKYILPYLAVVLFYIYIDINVIGFSRTEVQYRPQLNPKTILNSLAWYSVWSFGLPETLTDMVRPGLKLNPDLMKYWGNYYNFIFPAFFISVTILLLIIFLQRRYIFKEKRLLFLVYWFIIGLVPVLFLPLHKSTQYLTLSLPAFCAVIAFLLSSKLKWSKILSLFFLASFAVLTIYSVKVMDATYWAAQRGRISKILLGDLKTTYPILPSNSVIYVKNDPTYPFISKDWGGTSTQAFLILSGSDAIDLLYKDYSIKVYYEDRDKIPQSKIYPFVAKLGF